VIATRPADVRVKTVDSPQASSAPASQRQGGSGSTVLEQRAPVAPVVLAILDGWGYSPDHAHNAIRTAATPVMDALWHAYPHTLIEASGGAVGLPDGQMGNSEVGHLTIGSGRIIRQELVRISQAVRDGSIAANPALNALVDRLLADGCTATSTTSPACCSGPRAAACGMCACT
jgi:2,3-bisphosphoglycerate-independent phosphoglycerate mutase